MKRELLSWEIKILKLQIKLKDIQSKMHEIFIVTKEEICKTFKLRQSNVFN